MKDVSDWDEDYILNGIPEGEHDWVEFKRSEKLDLTLQGVQQSEVINELSKQLSAFANNGGGAIVYGIDDNGPTRQIDGSGGVSRFIKKNGTKEWLEDVIPNAVEFQIHDFNVYSIVPESADSGIQEGKAIYVIRVGDSEYAPHQANDKVYYSRVGGKSRPISHRMVMDIVGRQKHPEINLFGEIQMEYSHYDSNEVPTLILRYKNVGRIYANYINGWIDIPNALYKDRYGEASKTIDGIEYRSEYFENTIKETVGYGKGGTSMDIGGQSRFVPMDVPLKLSRYDPLLPGLSRRAVSEGTLSAEELEKHKELKIFWTIYADNAAPRNGNILVGDLLNEAPLTGGNREDD